MKPLENIIVKVSQYLVGILFILSGGIKANDALGFSYKLEEYFQVFSQIFTLWDISLLAGLMDWLAGLSLPMAMAICVFEIILGVATIFGLKMKMVTWNLLIMILFFTWLTGYTATCDPHNADNISCVSDCGCFGDAIPLTPVQSFYKDLILLTFISILFFYRKKIKPVFGNKEAIVAISFATIFPTIFTIYTHQHLPIKDFRTYKEGTNIQLAMLGKDGESEFSYVLKDKSTGEEKSFSKFPDNWASQFEYIGTEEKVIVPAVDPEITDFSILDADLNDWKEDYLQDSAISFMLISKNLRDLGQFSNKGGIVNGFEAYPDVKNKFTIINEFAENALKNNMKFIGLASSSTSEIDEFRNGLQTPFDFFMSDEKVLKTIIRSNPGLVLLKDGIILRKWHVNDFPNFEEVRKEFNLN